MPPSNIAERFPHLHADSVASQSALALEKLAHAATVNQDKMGRNNTIPDTNMEIISRPKKKDKNASVEVERKVQLSKNMQRKLRRLQEEEDKKKLRVEVMETLEKHKMPKDYFDLLQSSSTLGQKESMKEKLQRAMNCKRAGIAVPDNIPLFRERPRDQDVDEDLIVEDQRELVKGSGLKTEGYLSSPVRSAPAIASLESPKARKTLKRKKFSVGMDPTLDDDGFRSEKHGMDDVGAFDKKSEKVAKDRNEDHGSPKKKSRKPNSAGQASLTPHVELSSALESNGGASSVSDSFVVNTHNKKKKKKKKKKKLAEATRLADGEDAVADQVRETVDGDSPVATAEELEDVVPTSRPHDSFLKVALDTQAVKADLKLKKVAVPISRPEDVVKGRENLPIVMMEQEIIEAVSENDVVIVCGETGCGKTTQVPQFLFEAGFGSSLCPEKSGVIGVTQPRRVAVLATAKRVAYEMNVALGQEVGFQVRHDRKIGNKSCIKFMTDGILLRELQADFLLKKYSIVVLDEAHERSLNTDILIGMLSRILPLRKKLYEEQCKRVADPGSSSETAVMPLKLVIMSATLRVEDFTSNRRLFPLPPPVVKVPARQFPVTVHFSAKTELLDYVGRAEKKVCAIHRKLPPGGILVFLTGQREVEYLCRKLRRAFKSRNKNEAPLKTDVQGLTLGSISDAMDGHLSEAGGGRSGGLGGIADADENDGEKGDDQDFSDSDDEDFDGDGDDDSMSDSDEEEVVNLQSSLDAAEDNGNTDQSMNQVDPVAGTDNTPAVEKSSDPGPLYVLPLYAMLPAAAQLRVFAQVPEGARLVVVATNVAETSITIPGIRYVVDTGRSKERDFDRANGVSKYEVRWISKASANQRAGRAGRTGPGHCYRLYSSAVFNNIFPKFSPPEMNTAPIEGVVLMMKRMGICKVENFPFPTPPERQAILEADRCLRALSALDADTGKLTPMGKAMAVYPISPRHARMILAALHASQGMDGKGHIVLAFAVAAAAALSLENPFLRESGVEAEDAPAFVDKSSSAQAPGKSSNSKGNSRKDGDSEFTEEEKKKRKQRRADAGRAHGKYRNTHSDALSVVSALWAYEKAENREQFCELNFLHAKTMQEMAKLRQQLSQLVVQYSLDAGAVSNGLTDGSGLTKEYLLECERSWERKNQVKLNMNQEMVLQQAICAGWADRVARRLSARDRALIVEEDGKRKAIRYQASAVDETVFLHPASSLSREAPEFVVYNEIISTGRPYMWGVTAVHSTWLVSHASPLCTFSKPVAEPPPWYDAASDSVMCWVLPTFGPHRWELPPHSVPLKSDKGRVAVFAAALLGGKVVPAFKDLAPHLVANPGIIVKAESHGQVRVGLLLHKLGSGVNGVDSRRKLAAAWGRDPGYLYAEVLAWVQSKAHEMFKQIWTQAQEEALTDGGALYEKVKPKKKKNS